MTRQKTLIPDVAESPSENLSEPIVATHAAPTASGTSHTALVAVPLVPRPPFELELRRLVRQRLNDELDFEQFCRQNLDLHFRYGRRGYDIAQYERDIREYRERQSRAERRQELEQAVRNKLDLTDLTVPHPVSSDALETQIQALGA